MATITQTIPTYTGGISQQPDELKVPGQLNEAKNVLPDVTHGLVKRPGAKLIKSLSNGTNNSYATGQWFHYYRDENEQYIGQIIRRTGHADDGKVRMWSCLDGSEKTVVVGNGATKPSGGSITPVQYLQHTADHDIQTLTLNDHTYMCNRNVTVEMDNATSNGDGGWQETARPPEAFIELKNVAYSKQYALNLYAGTNERNAYCATRVSCDRVLDTSNTCQQQTIVQVDTWYPPEGIEPGTMDGTTRTGTGYNTGWVKLCGSGGVYNYKGDLVMDQHLLCVGVDTFQVTPGRAYEKRSNSNGIEDFYYYYRDNQKRADNEVHRLYFNENQTWLTGHKYRLTNTATSVSVEWTAGSGTGVDEQAEKIFEGWEAHSNWGTLTTDYDILRRGYTNNSPWSAADSRTVPKTGLDLVFRSKTNSNVYGNGRWKVEVLNGSSVVRTFTSTIWANRTIESNTNPIPKHLAVKIETTGQTTVVETSSYSGKYTTQSNLLFGGNGWKVGDYFYVWMTAGKYKITVEDESISKVKADLGLIRPKPTPFTGETVTTPDSILGDIRQAIVDATTETNAAIGWTDSHIEQIGNGLYITRPLTGGSFNGTFNVSTPNSELLNVFTDKVADVADLPKECKHGYVLKVSNSDSATEDDYYVKFFGHNDRDGPGVWEECVKPGAAIHYAKATMPVDLIRTADGNFRLTFLDGTDYTISSVTYTTEAWEPALVGDTDPEGEATNPWASFVGKKITQMLFFRNRLCLFADENVIMSQPGDFFNFWGKSAIAVSPIDVIDISASSEYPAIIYDGIQVGSGLVLFTKNQQFLLTTDSDVLSSQTAKINALSTYNFNNKTSPINLGTSLGFLDNAGKFSRFLEMTTVQRDGDPQVLDQSKVVGDLFAKDLRVISNSRENSVIFFSKDLDTTLYGYRYHNLVDKRLQQAWFTWEFDSKIRYHCVLDDSLYMVLQTKDSPQTDMLVRLDLKLTDTSDTVSDLNETVGPTLTDDDTLYRIHLDHSTVCTTAANTLTYNATTNKTTFTLPSNYPVVAGGQLAVYVIENNASGADNTFQGMTANASLSGTTVTLENNWKTYINASGATITPAYSWVLGYLYEMKVEFPTIHYQKAAAAGDKYRSETQGSLTVHRAKLSLGDSGLYKTTLKRTGKTDFIQIIEPPIADAYDANQISLTQESTKVIPIYERNTNATLILESTHASPATLYSMTWEGDYTNKFYRRV